MKISHRKGSTRAKYYRDVMCLPAHDVTVIFATFIMCYEHSAYLSQILWCKRYLYCLLPISFEIYLVCRCSIWTRRTWHCCVCSSRDLCNFLAKFSLLSTYTRNIKECAWKYSNVGCNDTRSAHWYREIRFNIMRFLTSRFLVVLMKGTKSN